MRVLLHDPASVSAGRYRRFVRRALLDGLLADHLYAGEPYLALNAVVLEASECALLRRLSGVFAAAFHKAGRAVAADVPLLVEMGFPWAAAELLAAETPRMPLLGRFDFIADRSGDWWLLEYNADTPSGLREAIVADALVHELLPDAAGLIRPNERLGEVLCAAFCRALAGTAPGLALGLLTDSGQLEDLAQMAFTARLLAEPLAGLGIEPVLGDTGNLAPARSGLTLCGRRIGALYRYVPFEVIFGNTAFTTIEAAASSGTLNLLNGLYGLLLQHKGLLAWLWQHRQDPLFTVAERAAIERHLPPAWNVSDLPAGIDPAGLVFKQVFGREGEEVFFGEDLAPDAVAEFVRRRTYIAQWRIQSPALTAALPSSLGGETRSGYLTVGSFVVDGQPCGFYTRFGDKIVTARAKWLATFAEARPPAGGGNRGEK